MEQKNSSSWDEIVKGISETQKNLTTASEIIMQKERESKAKNLGIVCLTIGLVTCLVINHLNARDFTEFLSQYDFVTQDGEGYNYFNSDVGGNVVNGTENNEEEEPGER